ncbi:MAG: hypothetical protein ACYDIE_02180, partial [Candidatus Krumholzibacteriia bacterium]
PAEADSLSAAWRPLLARAAGAGQGDDPADLYKLLHQGVMGPAHAVPSASAARDWLADEWREMAATADPPPVAWPLLEPIRPDSLLVRVHLRPLAALAGAGPDRDARLQALWRVLAAAFVRTAETWRGDRDRLRGLWARALADGPLWPAVADSARRAAFTAEVAAAGWPAVHHGAAFAATRAPHYRVVARAELPAAWLAAAGWPPPRGAAGGGAP